ncbi:MAG TPA: DUF2272 domain-containing protein [Acetobacteraceae bacterium]|nr:DUF2272 domain-containing protein [Acetobacteraceae bacterium]
MRRFLVPFVALAMVSGCAAPPKHPRFTPSGQIAPGAAVPPGPDEHVPAFAADPYEPFSRADAIAIALREWRLFGRPVDDDPPDSRPPPLPEDKPERMAGLWERVGEYWWISQYPDAREVAWTGMHNGAGNVFPADQDGSYAWSAAFISYVMRIAGAGDRFPYSANHSTYINAAAAGTSSVLRAQPPQTAPDLGDLICTGRGNSHGLRFASLPTAYGFPSHCDIVVGKRPGMLTVIGGNVDDAVTVKHVPTTPDGALAMPDGTVVDTRYPWLVVLKVLYDR